MGWGRFFRRDRWDEERARELETYLEIETDDNIARGMAPDEARYAAQRKLGNLALIREQIYRMNSVGFLDAFWYDLCYALRMLRNNPVFTTVAVVTLALGIGANTAIFSAMNAVLLRPLPYPHSERLVSLSERAPGLPFMYVSMANLSEWRARNTVFESVEGFRSTNVTLTGHGEPQRLAVRQVNAGFFPMSGVEPILGRALTARDDRPEADPVVLLSDSLWAREFGRDPGVLRKKVMLDGEAFTVVGIIPGNRLHMSWRKIDAFSPLGLASAMGGPAHRDVHNGVFAYARMKPGVTLAQADTEMSAIAQQLEERYPQTNQGQRVNVEPLLEAVIKRSRQPLLLLMGAVSLVLLIACANVANLLMSHAVVRRREIAVRSALGAGGGRLARQFLGESILLALIGGAAALLVAYLATAAIGHFAASIVPRLDEISIDRPVLLFTLGVTLLTGLVFGVFPALMAYRTDPNEVLKDTSHGSRAGLTRMGLRSFLAAAELALSLVLLVGAGLAIKSLFHVLQADLGFQPNAVLTASLSLPETKYVDDAQRTHFVESLIEKLAVLPGVKAVGLEQPLLNGSQTDFRVEGRPLPQPGQEPYAEISRVTPGALEALGVQLLSGRFFNMHDNEAAQPVCIIDDTIAGQYWPTESAIGKRIDFEVTTSQGVQHVWRTVVGTVHRLKNYGASGKSFPGAFLPFAQYPRPAGSLVILSDEPQSALEPMLRETVYSLDADMPLSDVGPLAEQFDVYVAPRRLAAVLLGILAGIALLLAAVGTYGVMAYMVVGRTPEIGVRRTLGAKTVDVLRLVLSHGIRVALAGLCAGVLGSLALGSVVSPMLFGVKASDPMTFASVGALLMAAASAACYIPARKAMGLDPIEAVRHE
jgi:predicted permease